MDEKNFKAWASLAKGTETDPKRNGRPTTNPYPQEVKLTMRIPKEVHRQLKFGSADTGKTMNQIVVESLMEYLKEYEDM